MQPRSFRFVSLLLVLGVALLGLGDRVPVASGSSEAPGVTPLAEPRWPQSEVDQVESLSTRCTELDVIPVPGPDQCTHGPDPAPGGLDEDQPVRPLSPEVVAAESTAATCAGDGQSGYRVQVLYVRASDVPSRYPQYLASIRGWAAEADQVFQASAAETGGSRSLRFVHDAICQLTVPEVVVSPAGDDGFRTTISELQSQGYTRTDRIYLAFVDTTRAGICGIGTIWDDDRPGSDNWNNTGPSYSRVDRGCWRGDVAAHELMHNLGGVQLSAPNTSGGFHCIDEYDIMCYKDSASSRDMRADCPTIYGNTTQLDCGHQDYFHTQPGPESYLASYWNPANNRFLINAAPPPPPPLPPAAPVPSVDDKDDKNKNKQGKKGKGKKGKGKKGKGHGKGKRKH